MGAWGTAIFSDDVACDVKDDYNDLLKCYEDDDKILDVLKQEYKSLFGDDEESVFWYALAAMHCQSK